MSTLSVSLSENLVPSMTSMTTSFANHDGDFIAPVYSITFWARHGTFNTYPFNRSADLKFGCCTMIIISTPLGTAECVFTFAFKLTRHCMFTSFCRAGLKFDTRPSTGATQVSCSCYFVRTKRTTKSAVSAIQ